MQTFKIDSLSFEIPLQQPISVKISYRKKSDPDIENNYIVVTQNATVFADGTFSSPVLINTFLPNTNYIIKYNIINTDSFYLQEVTSTTPVIVGNFIDSKNQAMPNMQYIDTTELGLLDSYLPEKIGCLYTFNSSFQDILEQFGNAQYTVIDNNKGISFEKRNNEIGLKIDSNVLTVISDPTDASGNNEASILGPNGDRNYSLGIWVNFDNNEFTQSGIDGKLWLIYVGDPNKHIGIYVNTTTKYVHWIHKNGSIVEEIILDHAIEANKWIRIFVRRDGTNPSDTYNNQILMLIDGNYYSPSVQTFFTSASNYSGRNNQPIYIGMGKQDSNGNIITTKGVYHYFYFRGTLTDNNLRERILNPPYPYVIIANSDLSNPFNITHEYFITIKNDKVSFVFPHNVPVGAKKMWYKTYSGDRPTKDITIYPFTKITNGFDIDFSNISNFENNKNEIVNKFYALHK